MPPMVSKKNATSASDRLIPSCRPADLSSSGVGSFALAMGSSFCALTAPRPRGHYQGKMAGSYSSTRSFTTVRGSMP